MRTSYLILICLAILGLASGVGYLVQPKHDMDSATIVKAEIKETDSLPKVAVVHPTELGAASINSPSYFGEILSDKDGQIFAYREGVIERLLVDLGSQVREGQVVALLSAGQLSPEYADMLAEREQMVVKAEAMVRVLEDNLARAKKLGASGDTTVEVVTEQQMLTNTKLETDAMIALEQEKVGLVAREVEVGLRDVFGAMSKIFYGGYFRIAAPTFSNSSFGMLNAQTIIDLNNVMSSLKMVIDKLPTKDVNAVASIGMTAADRALKTLDATLAGGDYTAEMFADDREEMNGAKDSLVTAWNEYQEQVAMLQKTKIASLAQVSDQEQKLARMGAEAEKMLITARADLVAAKRARDIVGGASASREVRSPFTGVITQRLVNVGQKISMNEPFFSLVEDRRGQNSSLFVRFEVPESELANIRVGDLVMMVRTQNPLQQINGMVERVGLGINHISRSVQVEARLNNPPADVLSHASVRVQLASSQVVPLTVPRDAVMVDVTGEIHVLIVREGIVQKQKIVTGRVTADRAVVTSGLTSVDALILEPGQVKVGDKVQAVSPEEIKAVPSNTEPIDTGEHGHMKM